MWRLKNLQGWKKFLKLALEMMNVSSLYRPLDFHLVLYLRLAWCLSNTTGSIWSNAKLYPGCITNRHSISHLLFNLAIESKCISYVRYNEELLPLCHIFQMMYTKLWKVIAYAPTTDHKQCLSECSTVPSFRPLQFLAKGSLEPLLKTWSDN